MQDTFYSPIIALGGHLTSMHRERPKGIFKFNVGFQSAIPKELLAGCGQRNGRVQIEGSGGPVFHPNGEITYRVRQPLKIRFNPSEGPVSVVCEGNKRPDDAEEVLPTYADRKHDDSRETLVIQTREFAYMQRSPRSRLHAI